MTTATPTAASGCSFSEFTATASSDVAKVAACETAIGDITFQGSSFGGLIDITGVRAVYGDLSVINATQATAFNAPTLQLVSGTLKLADNTILGSVNFAQLTTVGSLSYISLPALEHTGLTSGITSAELVEISDTGLTSLDGINVYKLKVFNVNNNGDISTINSGLQSVSDSLSIAYNSEQVEVTLDELTSANNIDLRKINSISASNLTTVNGSLSISSTKVDQIEFKGLESIGHSLTIDENENVEELDFPKLTSIGGAFEISENDKLRSFAGFPKLKTVGGSVNINGTFDNGTFDSLNRVDGGFTFLSDGDLSCSAFDQLNKDGDIKGDKYACSGAGSSSSSSSSKKGNSHGSSSGSSDSSDSSSSGSSSSSSSSKKSEGVAANGKLAAVMAVFAAAGVALY